VPEHQLRVRHLDDDGRLHPDDVAPALGGGTRGGRSARAARDDVLDDTPPDAPLDAADVRELTAATSGEHERRAVVRWNWLTRLAPNTETSPSRISVGAESRAIAAASGGKREV
jgi:hypothetical protein